MIPDDLKIAQPIPHFPFLLRGAKQYLKAFPFNEIDKLINVNTMTV
jgi:hypothetical protein